MIFSIDGIQVNISLNKKDLSNKIPLVFLHGFFGSSLDWEFLKNKLPNNFSPIFIDLPGHGKTSSPNNIDFYKPKFQIELLRKIFIKLSLNEIILVGYSMGGRLALSFSIKYPNIIKSIILESCSFGIKEKVEKEDRITADELLALKIKNSTIQEFAEYWANIPLFESMKNLPKNELVELNRKRIKTGNLIGLKNSLLGFGTGHMLNYFHLLPNFNNKVLLISGRLDNKFTNIAQKANKLLPNSRLGIVDDCGHNVHLEKPEEFLKLLHSFLLND